MAADYSQIELRIMAHLSQEGLLTAFAEGKISIKRQPLKSLVYHWNKSPVTNAVVPRRLTSGLSMA